jgi:hypothetical protein
MQYEKKIISLDRPSWEPPKIRAVETLLEEHKILTTGLCNNTIVDANIEPAIRNIIILAQSIDKRIGDVMADFEDEVKKEKDKIKNSGGSNIDKTKVDSTAYNRALIAIEGKAMAAISKFIQGEGTEMKIARVRAKQYDDKGNVYFLMEPDEADKFITEKAREDQPVAPAAEQQAPSGESTSDAGSS